MFDEIIDKMEAAIAALIGLIRAGHPLCGTVSGKDSTCATILMLEAVRRIGRRENPSPLITSRRRTPPSKTAALRDTSRRCSKRSITLLTGRQCL
jgi:hypothetical protein